MIYKFLPILILLSGCSYAYTPPENGEWVGGEKLKEDTEECRAAAEQSIFELGLAKGFGGGHVADRYMKRCMTQKGYVWKKK